MFSDADLWWILIEHMKIQMPDAFLKRWIQMNNEQPLADEQLEKEYPNYAESMRWQLLQQAVMKDADMRVTTEELEDEAKRVIGAQYAQYGMPLEGEMLDNFAKNALANEEERRRIADLIIERKVVDNLKPRVNIKEKRSATKISRRLRPLSVKEDRTAFRFQKSF